MTKEKESTGTLEILLRGFGEGEYNSFVLDANGDIYTISESRADMNPWEYNQSCRYHKVKMWVPNEKMKWYDQNGELCTYEITS